MVVRHRCPHGSGFSLVELIVAVGIAMGLGLVSAELIQMSFSSVNSARANIEATETMQGLAGFLRQPQNCQNSLLKSGGVQLDLVKATDPALASTTPPVDLSAQLPIKNSLGADLIPTVGAKMGLNRSLTVTSLTLINPRQIDTSRFQMDLLLRAERSLGGFGPRQITSTSSVIVTVERPSGKITDCLSNLTANNLTTPQFLDLPWGTPPSATPTQTEITPFIVPANVTRLRIEAWGAGGGGGGGGNTATILGQPPSFPESVVRAAGGGSGAYSSIVLENVTPGQILYIALGVGGNGVNYANGRAISGGPTCVSTSSNPTCSSGSLILKAPGGQGGIRGGVPAGSIGFGGGKNLSTGATDFSFFGPNLSSDSGHTGFVRTPGVNGSPVAAGAKCATDAVSPFTTTSCNPANGKGFFRPGGFGGSAPNQGGAGGGEAKQGRPGLKGETPGGGGGGSLTQGEPGGAGGHGRVIIWY